MKEESSGEERMETDSESILGSATWARSDNLHTYMV